MDMVDGMRHPLSIIHFSVSDFHPILMQIEEGGMSMPDLHTLIDTRIPEHRNQLEQCHQNLEGVANWCENNYLEATDKTQALEATKQFALQSLASVAYQINTMGRDLLDMLEIQSDNISKLTNEVSLVNQVVNIHKEKLARREIGVLTTSKLIVKNPKIIAPAMPDPQYKYRRTPIDFSVLDGVGHGVRTVEPARPPMISRAGSTISGSNHYKGDTAATNSSSSTYGVTGMFNAAAQNQQYERTATLGRTPARSGHMSIVASDYRVPQISSDQQQRVNRQISHGSDFGDHLSGGGSGSQHGSSDYGHVMGDRYGTIRANRDMGGGGTVGRNSAFSMIDQNNTITSGSGMGSIASNGSRVMNRTEMMNRADSPGLPLPPPQISSQHYGGYVAPGSTIAAQQQQYGQYGTLRATTNHNELPPPPDSLLMRSTHEDIDELPPPPAAIGGNAAYGAIGMSETSNSNAGTSMFDTGAEWVPEGEYIERAVVLYDYEAEKADELTLRENAVVYVVRKNDDGWYEGVLDGVTGLFPGNYVQRIE